MSNTEKIEKVDVGWSTVVVMICTKCGKQFSGDSDKEAPERMKSELKSIAKIHLGKSVRVINSSCLNICPVDKIAIAVASNVDSVVFRGFTVPVDATGEELFAKLLKS
jgi:ferredoxin